MGRTCPSAARTDPSQAGANMAAKKPVSNPSPFECPGCHRLIDEEYRSGPKAMACYGCDCGIWERRSGTWQPVNEAEVTFKTPPEQIIVIQGQQGPVPADLQAEILAANLSRGISIRK